MKYTVTIRAPRHGSGADLPGLFDMMRYDQSRVVDWAHEPDPTKPPTFTVTLESERCTTERWASFALYPQMIR